MLLSTLVLWFTEDIEELSWASYSCTDMRVVSIFSSNSLQGNEMEYFPKFKTHQELINKPGPCENWKDVELRLWLLPFPLQNLVEFVCLSITRCQVLISCCDWLPKESCASKCHNFLESRYSVMPKCIQRSHVVQTTNIKKHNELVLVSCGTQEMQYI